MVPLKRTRLPPLSISPFSLISSPNIPSRPAPVIWPCINFHRKRTKAHFLLQMDILGFPRTNTRCSLGRWYFGQISGNIGHTRVLEIFSTCTTIRCAHSRTYPPSICPPGLHCNVRERKHTRYQNQYKSESWISMDNHHYRRWNWAPDGSDNANHQWWRAPLNVPSCARSTYSCARAHSSTHSCACARTERRLFQVLRQRSGNYGWGWEACGGDVCRVTQLAGHAIQNIVLFTSNHHHHLSFFFACRCGHHLIQN